MMSNPTTIKEIKEEISRLERMKEAEIQAAQKVVNWIVIIPIIIYLLLIVLVVIT